ncbi:hypothetical protein GEMRC1_005954 [Eukaryota sp. GEM-RC1]
MALFIDGLENFTKNSNVPKKDKSEIPLLQFLNKKSFFEGINLPQSFLIDCYLIACTSLLHISSSPEYSRNVFEQGANILSADSSLSTIFYYYRAIFELSPSVNSVDFALKYLVKIPKSSPVFFKAKLLEADIYLSKSVNISKYLECFTTLIDVTSGLDQSEVYYMLGEAYLKVSKPKAGLDSFFKSLEVLEHSREVVIDDVFDDKKSRIFARIAKLYTNCHQFASAIEYYQKSVDVKISREVVTDYVSFLERLGKKI